MNRYQTLSSTRRVSVLVFIAVRRNTRESVCLCVCMCKCMCAYVCVYARVLRHFPCCHVNTGSSWSRPSQPGLDRKTAIMSREVQGGEMCQES